MNVNKNTHSISRYPQVTNPEAQPESLETKPAENHEQEKPLALPVFKIEYEAIDKSITSFLNLHDESLADLAFKYLDLSYIEGISRRPGNVACIIGESPEVLSKIKDFAILLSSVTSLLPNAIDDDAAHELRHTCGWLAMSSCLKMNDGGVVIFDPRIVEHLAKSLAVISQKSPEAAFAFFSRCSVTLQLAILADTKSGTRFFLAIATDAQVMKLADVFAGFHYDDLVRLCKNVPKIPAALQILLPSADHSNPADPLGWLRQHADNFNHLRRYSSSMEFMPWPLPKESSNALAISLIEDAINAKNYKFLEDLCKIFLHNERGANNNGQLLVADVLGNFAAQLLGWGNWTGNKEHAGKIVATFLNFAPTEAAMKHFAESSQGILTTESGSMVWSMCESTLTEAGLKARTEWGNATLQLAKNYPENPRWQNTILRVQQLMKTMEII